LSKLLLLVTIFVTAFNFEAKAFESCEYLFRANTLDIINANPSPFHYGFESSIGKHSWWVKQLTQGHLKEKIQNTDPFNGHIDQFQFVLSEALRYVAHNITPPMAHSWMLQPLGKNRIESLKLIAAEDAHVQEGLYQSDLYLFLKNKLDEHIRNGTVSFYFYHAMSEMITGVYQQAVIYGGYHKLLNSSKSYFAALIAGNGQTDFFEKQFEEALVEAEKLGTEDIRLPYYALADFYDFIDLLPDVVPAGVLMDGLTPFDGNNAHSPDYRKHDLDHAVSFYKAYNNLSAEEKNKFHEAIQFLRSYRSQLTPSQQVVFGSIAFTLMYERFNLRAIIALVDPHAEQVFDDGIFASYYEKAIVTTYYLFLDNRNYGATYRMNVSGLEFTKDFKRIVLKMREQRSKNLDTQKP
jgi:hypothetical protein